MSGPDDWEQQYSPYSPAGQIEGMGRFAAGLNRRRRQGRSTGMRWVGLLVVLALLAGMLASVLTAVLR